MASLTVRLELYTPRRREPKKPARPEIDVVSSTDRPLESLAVAAGVDRLLPKLERCLISHRASGSGRVSGMLETRDGAIHSAQIAGAGDMADCWAGALAEANVGFDANAPLSPRTKIRGVFECSFSYGANDAAPGGIALELEASGLRVGDRVIEVRRSERPPDSATYKHLLSVRFSGDSRPSPAPASLVIEPDVRGHQIISLLESARAADIEVRSVAMASAPVAPALALPRPRLSELAGRAPAISIIVGPAQTWIGLGADVAAESLATITVTSVGARLDSLRGAPGMSARRDAVVGIAAETTADRLAPVLDALAQRGFDQVVILDAESARARLAR